MEVTHYYPFGMTWKGTWQNQNTMPLNNKYGYNGKEELRRIGLLDYGFRFYDPAIARFSTIDPLAEDYTFQNQYAYAANNPIRYIDFMGLGATYNWDEHKKGNKGVYNDGKNNVSWNDVKNEYGIENSSSSNDPQTNGIGLSVNYTKRSMQLASLATEISGDVFTNNHRGTITNVSLANLSATTTISGFNSYNYLNYKSIWGSQYDVLQQTSLSISRTGRLLSSTALKLSRGATVLGGLSLGYEWHNALNGNGSVIDASIRTTFFVGSVAAGSAIGGPPGTAVGIGIGVIGEGTIFIKNKVYPPTKRELYRALDYGIRWTNWKYK